MEDKGISIKVESKEVDGMLGSMYAAGANMSPVLKRISQMLRSFALENFEQEGRPKWDKHSQVTEELRKSKLSASKQQYASFKILQKSGALKRSIVPFNSSIDAGVGSVLRYARIHQLGGYAGRNRKVCIPARPYLDPTEEDMNVLAATVQQYLLRGVK